MITGWITGHKNDTQFLVDLGVKISATKVPDPTYPREVVEWTVEMTEEVFDKLDPLWGRFIWTLEVKDAKD